MGFYYTTYLHYGNFEEQNQNDYTVLASMDPVLEYHEKLQGFVGKSDIQAFLEKYNIHFEFRDNEEQLFITEVSCCTLDSPPSLLYTTVKVV